MLAALEALQHEAGLKYVPEKLDQGGTLMSLVWDHCEATIAQQLSAASIGEQSSHDTALEVLQRRAGPSAECLRLQEAPLLAGMDSNPIAMCRGLGPIEFCVATGVLCKQLCVFYQEKSTPREQRLIVASDWILVHGTCIVIDQSILPQMIQPTPRSTRFFPLITQLPKGAACTYAQPSVLL